MHEYVIKFFSKLGALQVKFTAPNKATVDQFHLDFITPFIIEKDNDYYFPTCLVVSQQLRDVLNDFVEKYKATLPQINEINSILRKLPDEAPLVIFPGTEVDDDTHLKVAAYLSSVLNGKDINEVYKELKGTLGKVLENYIVTSFGKFRVSIGEADKAKRVCRFCGNKRDKILYTKVPHAISKGLGNKRVILLEECDECNKELGDRFEQDIIQYFSLYRSFYNIKGYGGSKKIKGKDFEIEYGDNGPSINLFNDNKPIIEGNTYTLNLKGSDKVIKQNVYKALCKFFISVIDRAYLAHFNETICWINCDDFVDNLPYIYGKLTYENSIETPTLSVFLRKTNNENMPFAIGEFNFTCIKLIFIVPLFNNHEGNKLIYKRQLNKFLNLVGISGGHFIDLSNNKPLRLDRKLIFTLPEDSNIEKN